MKICIVSVEYPPTMGGSGVYAYNLAVQLKNLGHDIFVITRRLLGQKKIEIIEGIKIYRILWIPIPMLYIPLFSILSFKFLIKLHRKQKFDIIHGNWNCDWFYKKDYLKTPLVSTMHGTWIGEYKSVLYQPLKYYGINDLAIRIFGKFFGKIDKKTGEKTDKLIVVSNFSKNEVIKYYNIPEDKISVISNGVDLSLFHFNKKEDNLNKKKGTSEFLMLFVGRLVARKAPQILINSFYLVKKELSNIKLIIVGSGPLKKILLKKIRKLNLEENILILSNISFKKLASIYSISNLFILHSYYEAQGIVLLEAMASGVPIIATNVGGVPETTPEGICAKLIEPGNSKLLAKEIINLIHDKKLRKKLRENGLDRIKNSYDWSNLVIKVEKEYRNLLKK